MPQHKQGLISLSAAALCSGVWRPTLLTPPDRLLVGGLEHGQHSGACQRVCALACICMHHVREYGAHMKVAYVCCTCTVLCAWRAVLHHHRHPTCADFILNLDLAQTLLGFELHKVYEIIRLASKFGLLLLLLCSLPDLWCACVCVRCVNLCHHHRVHFVCVTAFVTCSLLVLCSRTTKRCADSLH